MTLHCHRQHASRIGGNIRFTRWFGISMIRKLMTMNPLKSSGAYTRNVLMVCSAFTRRSMEMSTTLSNHANSTRRSAAMMVKFWFELRRSIPRLMAKVTAVDARIMHVRLARNQSPILPNLPILISFVANQRTMSWLSRMAIMPYMRIPMNSSPMRRGSHWVPPFT